jgi:DNA-binding LacI/PurR family transcriptional regulator
LEKKMSSVTIRDVARHAGVGVGTVSRVLNDSPSVSQSTRRRVLATIEELNFQPSLSARRLSLGKTFNVAVIAPFFTRPVFIERLRGVEHALAESEFDLVLFNVETVDRRDACFRNVARRERIDGLLVMALSPWDDEAEQWLEAQVPTVLIDARHPALNRLVIDDVEGGRIATEHLLELGHRRIGFISDYLEDPFGFSSSRDRFEGYYMALEAADVPFRPEYHRQGIHGREQARKLALELLTMPERPTAIFAASDTQASGVLAAARELSLQVPQNLSVIGYDDIEIAEYLHLTTMRQPSFRIGVEGVRLLMETIERPPSSPKELQFSTELVVRSSTAAPGGSVNGRH